MAVEAVGEARGVARTPASGLLAPRGLLGLALLVPSLIFLVLFTYWPVVEVVEQSLTVSAGVGKGLRFGGLDNYVALFEDGTFRQALWNNLVYAVGTVAPSLVLALGFALALERSTWFNAALRAVIFLPVLVPLVAAASIFLFLFLPGVGLIDYYLARLGVASPNWLGDPEVALASVMGLTIWKNAGYYMLFFLAGLQNVPGEIREAATLDGARPWQRAWDIIIPCLKPTIAFVLVIALLNVVTQVDHVFILTKGGPSQSTNLLLFYIYSEAVENYDIGRASAATVVSLAFLLIISVGSIRTLERGAKGEKR